MFVDGTTGTNFLSHFYKVNNFDRLLTKELHEAAGEIGEFLDFNAMYVVDENSIEYFLMLLQKPLFNPAYPVAFSYGSTGFIIGNDIRSL